MKLNRDSIIALTFAACAFGGMTCIVRVSTALAGAPYPVSNNIAGLPHRPDIEVTPVNSAAITASATDAVQAAEREFPLTDAQIDPGAGVVQALVGIRGDTLHGPKASWVVTLDYDMREPGSHELFHKLCVVVDGRTGQYEYAYQADPDPAA